jgi:hypothetical protein
MTNSEDQSTPAVPPVPPAPVTPPEPAPVAPPVGEVRPDPYAAPAYPTAPPAYAPAGNANPYAPTGPVEPKGLSITSMILGIVGLLSVGFGLLISIAAVVTGHLGQRRQPTAKPFWLTGLITGYIGIAVGLAVTIGFIIFFVFLANADYNTYDQYSYNS